MPPIAPSPSRPYVSRRKRRLLANNSPLLGTRFLLGLLGLLVVALLVSLGIIATHFVSPDIADTVPPAGGAVPANLAVSR